ncbi:hypothetical protein A2U01_0029337, partial [Trifolium medium]|nr:hypothetical protein [Trifolium medium]
TTVSSFQRPDGSVELESLNPSHSENDWDFADVATDDDVVVDDADTAGEVVADVAAEVVVEVVVGLTDHLLTFHMLRSGCRHAGSTVVRVAQSIHHISGSRPVNERRRTTLTLDTTFMLSPGKLHKF